MKDDYNMCEYGTHDPEEFIVLDRCERTREEILEFATSR
jgi:hypothetical protein